MKSLKQFAIESQCNESISEKIERDINFKEEEAISDKITDEMLDEANKYIDDTDKNLRQKEVKPRHCGFSKYYPNQFFIKCETRSEYLTYSFEFEGNSIKFIKSGGGYKGGRY